MTVRQYLRARVEIYLAAGCSFTEASRRALADLTKERGLS